MKLLFWQWNAFMQKGMELALKKMKIEYDVFYHIPKDWEEDEELARALYLKLQSGGYDRVLSVNYAPVVSDICEKMGISYISWIYDSPVHFRNKESFHNSCNQIYMFDRGQAENYRKLGFSRVKHLPLAADSNVWTYNKKANYDCDVALVGKLYQSDYSYLLGPLDEYYRGRMEGMVAAQGKIYGGYILDQLITDSFMEELNVFYDKASKGTFQVKKEELEYACACEVTGRERFMALSLLENRCKVNLYSGDREPKLAKVNPMGYVDYYTQMPAAFSQAKINLNISLRTIRTGIPLRVLDVLSCGGFLITNYQEELLEHFEPGVDMVIYEDVKDLVQKTMYYLQHEEERMQIAENGKQKVQELFSFEKQMKMLLGTF